MAHYAKIGFKPLDDEGLMVRCRYSPVRECGMASFEIGLWYFCINTHWGESVVNGDASKRLWAAADQL